MPSIRKATLARKSAGAEAAAAPPPDTRVSRNERRAQAITSAILKASPLLRPKTSKRKLHRARIIRFLHPDDPGEKPKSVKDARAVARERMRRLVNEWDQVNGILSLDEMMGLAALGLSDGLTEGVTGTRPHLTKSQKLLDARADEMAWFASSLEYALIWKFCEDDPELRGSATQVAHGRTQLRRTIERALRLYIAMLGQNLRARGVSPDRVIQFSKTGRRPVNPILPEGMSFEESKAEGWHDRTPLGRAMERGAMNVEI